MVLQLDKWVIAFAIFGMFIIAGLLITVDIEQNYDVSINDSSQWENLTKVVNETYGISEDMDSNALGGDIESDGILGSMLKGSYKALKSVRNTFSLFTGVIHVIADELNIPSFFVTTAITIMVLAVMFALIYLFMRIIPT